MIQKTIKFLLAGTILMLVSMACSKTDQTTSLEIVLINSGGGSVGSATVTLYKSQSDLANNTNIQDVQVSDSKGTVLFDNLSGGPYYYNAYKGADCSTNAFTKTVTSSLSPGQLNIETDTLYQIGQATFKNNSGDAYDLSINGKFIRNMTGGVSFSANLKVATYAVHIKQTTGISGTPNEKNYSLVVTPCSSSLTLSFP